MSASNQVGAFNYAVPSFGNLKIKNIAAAYLVSPSDNNFIVNCSANTFTVALPSAASLPIGFNITIWNTGTGTITIDPNGTETIDVQTTLLLQTGEGLQIVCDGANFQTGSGKDLRQYSEKTAASNTRPSATGSASFAIGVGATTAGGRAFAIGWGTSASPDYSAALGLNSSGNGAIVPGISATGAMALGGSYASGTDSFAAAIGNNTSTYGATGANSFAFGSLAKASNSGSIAMGTGSSSSGVFSVCIGGSNSWPSAATQRASVALGEGANSVIAGKMAFSGTAAFGLGGAQAGTLNLIGSTTNATAKVLTSNDGAGASTNQVILPNSSAYAFSGIVVARQQAAGGTASAAWKVEGLIRREANAGTTTLVFSLVTAISNVPLWTLALSADTTNGGLAVTATGAAATNIYWVANIETSEVTYA